MSNSQVVLSAEKTTELLNKFFGDCEKFWTREKEKYSHNYKEEINVIQNALKDTANITTNPFSPNGAPLNMEAKAEWLAQKGYIKK